MKLLACLFVLSLGFPNACKKEGPIQSANLQTITSHVWIYEEYYKDFGTPNSQMVFKRGRPQNSMDLSLNQVKFNDDGTYWEIAETGNRYEGTWKFLDNETRTVVINITGIYNAKIIRLDAGHLEWHGESVGRYGRMIPL